MNRKSSGLASLQSGISAGLSAYAAGGPVKHLYGGGDFVESLNQQISGAAPLLPATSQYSNPSYSGSSIGLNPHIDEIMVTGARAGIPYTGYTGFAGIMGRGGLGGYSGQTNYYDVSGESLFLLPDGSIGTESEAQDAWAAAKGSTYEEKRENASRAAAEQPTGQTIQDYLGLTASEEAARRGGATLYLPQEQYERAQGLNALVAQDVAAMTPEQRAAYQDAQVLSPSEAFSAVRQFVTDHPEVARGGLGALIGGISERFGLPISAIANVVRVAADRLGFGRDTTPTASEQRQISAEQNATNTPEIFVTGSRNFDNSDFMTNPFATSDYGVTIPGTEYLGDQTGAAETTTTPIDEVIVSQRVKRDDSGVPVQVTTPDTRIFDQYRLTDTGGAKSTEEDTTRIEDTPTITVPGSTPPIISEGGGQAGLGAFRPTGKKDWGTFTMPTLGPYRQAPLVQTGTDTSSGMSFQTYAPGALDDYLARLQQFQRGPQTAGIGGAGYQTLPGEKTEAANEEGPVDQHIEQNDLYHWGTSGPVPYVGPEIFYGTKQETGMAAGGIASLPEYRAGGKLLNGPGDGMSDSIPAVIKGEKPQRAALADGEFVVPADVVSHLGNGSTKAGAELLYDMMAKIRQARTGRKRQAPAVKASKFLPA
jgi:hypothetical protein